MKRKWAFIYSASGCDPQLQQAVLESEQHISLIYGVSGIVQGCQLAKQLAEEGCQLIELCGGFGPEGARQVIEAIGGSIPVGYIDYFPEELVKLKAQKKRPANS